MEVALRACFSVGNNQRVQPISQLNVKTIVAKQAFKSAPHCQSPQLLSPALVTHTTTCASITELAPVHLTNAFLLSNVPSDFQSKLLQASATLIAIIIPPRWAISILSAPSKASLFAKIAPAKLPVQSKRTAPSLPLSSHLICALMGVAHLQKTSALWRMGVLPMLLLSVLTLGSAPSPPSSATPLRFNATALPTTVSPR